ncbi:L-Aspartate dehydrogenase [Actinomycetales bacterium JB111]|nr:L-Aspartate dehydrogenase [Actinomycetales bacterium JB111]
MATENSSAPRTPRRVTEVGIASLGAIGRVLASCIGDIPGYHLAAVSARRTDRARDHLSSIGSDADVVDAGEIAERADLVIECAPAAVFREIAEPVIARGGTLVPLSAGALLANWDLVDQAAETGATIHVPSGAILGLDAIQGAAQGSVASVRMITRKPVRGLVGAPFLVEQGIDLSTVTEPVRIFSGTARQAIEGFPANLNVAVALSLAGVGPDRTEMEVWADPDLTRNTHVVEVDSDSARLELRIENIPSENPATGRLTALSVLALLRKLRAPLRIGT